MNVGFWTNTNLCLAWHWSHCCLYHEGSRFYAAARWLLKLKVVHVQRLVNKCNFCIKSLHIWTVIPFGTDPELSNFWNFFWNLTLCDVTKNTNASTRLQHLQPGVCIALWNLRVFFLMIFCAQLIHWKILKNDERASNTLTWFVVCSRSL